MRICTWNIQLGLRLDAVLDAVTNHPDFATVDMLAVQEASVHDGRQDAEAIAQAMGPAYRYFQATAQMLRGRDQGNALIWRAKDFAPVTPTVVTLSGTAGAQLSRAER